MATRIFRTLFSMLLPIVVLLFAVGCETSPTDDDTDQQNDTTETNDTTGSDLANRNSEFNLIDSINYADPGRTDSRDETVVRVRTNPRDYAGKSNVHLYELPAGYVTDRVFHGNVVREGGSRDLSIYYSGRMDLGSTLWQVKGWLPYPLSAGQRAVVLMDSTNSGGTIRQIVTWSAQRNGVEAVTVMNKAFEADVIDWEMEATRTEDGETEILVRYSGRDLFVEEMKFPAERYIQAEIDHELFFSSKSWVVDYELK